MNEVANSIKKLRQEKQLSQEQLAEQLSVARPSLSRELGQMQRDGILDIHGNKISIVDLKAFESYL